MTDQLDTLYERASIVASAPDIPPAAHERIDELWEEVHAGVDVTNEAAFGPFLAEFIREQHAETPEDERRDRLCQSGNYLCDTLHGKVPTELRRSSGRFSRGSITIGDGRQYVAENNQCIVVVDAVQAWESRVAETKRKLQQVIKVSREHGSGPQLDPNNVPGTEESA